MIKAIIFDYGGVVVPRHTCLDNIAAAFTLPKKAIIKAVQSPLELFRKGLISEDQFWQQFSSILGKPVPQNKRDLWRRGHEETFYIYPEIISFIRKIKAQGMKTAVLSNVIEPHVEITNKRKGYKEFDVVVLSCKVNLQKPQRAIYLLTTKKLGVKPAECIFVDDREKNLRPAKSLGMKTVLAQDQKQIIEDISRIIRQ